MNEIMTSPRVADDYLGDPWKRKHYDSPALQNVDKLSMTRPQDIISLSGLASVGLNNRLNEVMRWKPRNVSWSLCRHAPRRCRAPTDKLSTAARQPERLGYRNGHRHVNFRHHRRRIFAARSGGCEQTRSGEGDQADKAMNEPLAVYHILYHSSEDCVQIPAIWETILQ